MPKIKIEKVISFSSEDSVHVANNILSNDPSKKWKCQAPGEKAASLVLQLEKASAISSIDIGNENSAYIEVLVNRSTANDDYKMLLVMSSFMTPLEARQSTNMNKVRMFSQEHLSKPECYEKWDRVKIVCTQPFNRHTQYGLSFVTFHSTGENVVATTNLSTVGKFSVRPESPDNLTAGSLFARRKELQENKPLTAAAAIREASSSCINTQKSPLSQKKINLSPAVSSKQINTATKNSPAPRNRNELLYTKDEEEPHKKIDDILEKKSKETKEKQGREESSKNTAKMKEKKEKETKDRKETENKIEAKKIATPAKTNKRNNDKPGSSTDSSHSPKRKKTLKDTPNKKIKLSKPSKLFSQLLDGVVLVISGIQNPDRANIRTMALSMGAKYKSDWDNSCTHLICAFPNTPKFNQVKGKGKIVTKKWIFDCNSSRKRIPWRRYALDKSDQGVDESEDEICELIAGPSNGVMSDSEDNNSDMLNNKKEASDTEDAHKSVEILQKSNDNNDTDTEDEIERIQNLQSKKEEQNGSDIYNDDTDEETISKDFIERDHPTFLDLFSNKSFYIDPHFNIKEKILLSKYIHAYDGTLTSQDDSVDIVISSTKYKSAFKDLPSSSSIVSPDFIWECHNAQKLIPFDNFKI